MSYRWIINNQDSVTDQVWSVCWRRRSLCAELQSEHWWGAASETGRYLLWHHHHWTAHLTTPERARAHTHTHTHTHTQLWLSMDFLTSAVRSSSGVHRCLTGWIEAYLWLDREKVKWKGQQGEQDKDGGSSQIDRTHKILKPQQISGRETKTQKRERDIYLQSHLSAEVLL